LGAATWQEVEAAGETVLAVPLGATEQHGPHLPLETDTAIARAVAAGAAAERPEIAVAPALPYGSSGEHAGFPGTISIGQEATELVLVELCRSAAASFGRVLFVCGHGGNVVPVNRAVKRLRNEGREVRAWSPRWEGDAHAGRLETSLMLAIAPELVRADRAAPGNTKPVEELFGDLVARGVRPLTTNGVLGDPAGASAREGRELLAGAVADLVAVVDGWVWPAGRVEAA
jgi:mycofactocin precursor peptide peptidase